MQIDAATVENSMEGPQKVKIELSYDLEISLLGINPQKTIMQKGTCIPMFITALSTIARTWKQPRCPPTDEWIKNIPHHKKEWNWVICRDVDGSGDGHTEWSKSEREKQISCINTYIWNVENRYWWTYFGGRNREAEIENRHVGTEREGEGGTNWESSLDV